MQKFLTPRFLITIGLGMVAGYAYYYFIGCSSGSCSITASPVNSTLYGGLMGWLLADAFPNNKKQNNEQHSGND